MNDKAGYDLGRGSTAWSWIDSQIGILTSSIFSKYCHPKQNGDSCNAKPEVVHEPTGDTMLGLHWIETFQLKTKHWFVFLCRAGNTSQHLLYNGAKPIDDAIAHCFWLAVFNSWTACQFSRCKNCKVACPLRVAVRHVGEEIKIRLSRLDALWLCLHVLLRIFSLNQETPRHCVTSVAGCSW